MQQPQQRTLQLQSPELKMKPRMDWAAGNTPAGRKQAPAGSHTGYRGRQAIEYPGAYYDMPSGGGSTPWWSYY